MLDALDSASVRSWSRATIELLEAHRDEINALNVFPVPDSDTGSNLLLTFRAAEDALTEACGDPAAGDLAAAELLAAMADGAARGASGNSGFIASQIVRGLADAAAGARRCDGAVLAAGLSGGALLGHGAVVGPVEGTILTVVRAAADAAGTVVRAAADAAGTVVRAAADAPGTVVRAAPLVDVVRAAYTAAEAALQRTPSQLPELAQAGVVDAGGRGLVVVLAALLSVVSGEPPALPPVRVPLRSITYDSDGSGLAFEIQYLLDAPEDAVERLREVLDALGDSVAVVGTGAGHWNVHVHADDVGAAIEAGVVAGRPHQISVTRFADQLAADPHPRGPSATPAAVVAIAPGLGLAHLFEREGVRVVEGGPSDLPTVEEVVAAIGVTGARELVLLPNARRVTGVAEAAAEQARAGGLRVTVVPTRSPVQGLAAIAVHDAARRFDDDVVAMAEAAAATRFAEIVVARTEALTAVGICQPGDVLGLIDGEVVEIGRGLLAVAFGIVDRLLGVGAELMTVLVGEGAPRRTGELIEAHVRGRSPFTDVTAYEGGQPDHPVIIGVE